MWCISSKHLSMIMNPTQWMPLPAWGQGIRVQLGISRMRMGTIQSETSPGICFIFLLYILAHASRLYEYYAKPSPRHGIQEFGWRWVSSWHLTLLGISPSPDQKHKLCPLHLESASGVAAIGTSCNSESSVLSKQLHYVHCILTILSVDSVCQYEGLQCNPYNGYGLSSGLQGSLKNIDDIPNIFWGGCQLFHWSLESLDLSHISPDVTVV